jgi:aspartate/methionine/tyrosine aminotransferase
MLLSNPANPTGQSLEGDELENYVKIARELGVALLMDEFYSHYYCMCTLMCAICFTAAFI